MDIQQNKPNSDDLRELNTCKNLITFANVLGPVSLLIGGVFMGTAGLVCAIVARVKLGRLTDKSKELGVDVQRYLKSSMVAIIICIAAIVLNAIALYLYMPVLLETLNSMDLSSFMTSEYGSSSAGSPSSTSTWG